MPIPFDTLKKKFETAPSDIQEALESDTFAKKIVEIGAAQKITNEQVAILADQVGYVLLGIVHPNDFTKNVAAELKVSQEKALQISNEVSGKLFQPLRDSIIKVHNIASDADFRKVSQMPQSIPQPQINRTMNQSVQSRPPETHADHLLSPIPTPIEITGKTTQVPSPIPSASQPSSATQPPHKPLENPYTQSQQTTPQKPAPQRPAEPIRTLEGDIKQEASIIAQKLNKTVTLPKEEKLDGPLPRPQIGGNRADPYRESV